MNSGIQAMVGLALLGGLAGLTVGGVMCIFRGLRDRGKQIAFYSWALLVFSFSFFAFQPSMTGSDGGNQTTQAAAIADEGASKRSSSLAYSEVLAKLRVTGFSFRKEGFGTMMKATFVVHNDSLIPVKDIEVTCNHSANSGTIIDSNTRTVYEVVNSKSYVSVVNMDMGFIHSKVVDSSCKITAFSRA